MQTGKILVADDETSLREGIAILLRKEGYETCEAKDGLEALSVFEEQRPDLVILDVMMPRLDGFEACKVIRRMAPSVPVIFLTARGTIVDKTSGFHSGGNDYMTKPFDNQELLLRVESLLRTVGNRVSNSSVIAIDDLTVDLDRREVQVGDKAVILTPKEFDIMALMARNAGRVYSRQEIIDEVWGSEYRGTAISVPYFVRHIREKIEPDPAEPRYLCTVGRMGYRLGK